MADRPTPTGPAAPELSIVESRVYRGGNIWSYSPAIHLVVDLGVLEAYPTDTLDGFTDRLVELLPSLENHTCSRGVKGGFIERMREGTWLGHVAEHVSLQLQQEAGHDLRRGKTRAVKGQTGVYNVIYDYADEAVGLAAGTLAVRLVNHLVQAEEGFDFAEELDVFLRRAQRTAFGPSTGAILEEAISRDIPYIRLNSASFVQLGQGVHAQRIRATMTSKTGALAVDIAGDKDMTTRLLGSAGLPVPKQETVRTADGAVAAAKRIGYPVVVKPLDGNHGRGVCLDLTTEEDVRAELRHRRGRVAAWLRHRRVARHGSRLPLPHRRRQDAGHRRARPRPRHRRRHATRWPSSWRSPMPTPVVASATRRCSPGSRSTTRRSGSCETRASSWTRCRPRTRWSSSPSPATCRPVASRSTAPSTRTPTTSRSPRRPPA